MSMLEVRNLEVRAEDKQILRGVNLTVNKGEVHAIMGPNGSGKSTLAHVLSGRENYQVTGGRVTIDGQDVRDVTMGSLRSQIGIVLQDTYLFSDTVMNSS